jgi:uncharacterized protein (DUF934 family)
MKLIQKNDLPDTPEDLRVIELANDADPLLLVDTLKEVDRVDLNFPKFTDGRAFSQAWLLRRRLRYQGTIRATGDVLIDQLLQMQRTGFSEAVLREDQDAAHGQSLLQHFDGFYQGDVTEPRPRFVAQAA